MFTKQIQLNTHEFSEGQLPLETLAKTLSLIALAFYIVTIFHEIAPNFTYRYGIHKNLIFFFLKCNWNYLDHLFLPYKFYSRDI